MREKGEVKPPRVKIRHPETGETVFCSASTAEQILAGSVEEDKSLADLTKKELVEYAESHDLDVDTSAHKGDLLAAIEAAEAE